MWGKFKGLGLVFLLYSVIASSEHSPQKASGERPEATQRNNSFQAIMGKGAPPEFPYQAPKTEALNALPGFLEDKPRLYCADQNLKYAGESLRETFRGWLKDPENLQTYLNQHSSVALSRLHDAKKANSLRQMDEILYAFPFTPASREANTILVEHFFDNGEFVLANFYAERLKRDIEVLEIKPKKKKKDDPEPLPFIAPNEALRLKKYATIISAMVDPNAPINWFKPYPEFSEWYVRALTQTGGPERNLAGLGLPSEKACLVLNVLAGEMVRLEEIRLLGALPDGLLDSVFSECLHTLKESKDPKAIKDASNFLQKYESDPVLKLRKKEVERLVRHSNPEVRASAIRLLAGILPYDESPNALDTFILPALSNPDPKIRHAALDFVIKRPKNISKNIFVDLIKDPDGLVRGTAFEQLMKYHPLPPEIKERLEEILQEKEPSVGKAIASALLKEWKNEDLVPSLLLAAEDSHPATRLWGIKALLGKKLTDEIRNTLIAHLSIPDESFDALKVLSGHGPKEIKAISSTLGELALNSRSSNTRELAGALLASTGNGMDFQKLRSALASTDDLEVLRALELAGTLKEHLSFEEFFSTALKATDPRARSVAVRAAWRLNNEELLDRLIAEFNGPNSVNAIEAFRTLKTRGRKAFDTLQSLALNNEKPATERVNALLALGGADRDGLDLANQGRVFAAHPQLEAAALSLITSAPSSDKILLLEKAQEIGVYLQSKLVFQALRDPDLQVRRAAANLITIPYLGIPGSVKVLESLMEKETDPNVLRSLNAKLERNREINQWVAELSDPSSDKRFSAAKKLYGLTNLSGFEWTETLSKLAKNEKDPRTRTAIEHVIRLLDDGFTAPDWFEPLF